MNDLSLPSPVARARDLARLIAAEADAIERGRRLTAPVVEELHRARLFRMLYPSWIGAHGTVVEPDGSLRLNNFGRPTLRTWLFPVEQAVLLDNWNPIGLRGTASESYTVEDLFVPEELTGTREDPTLRREPGALY